MITDVRRVHRPRDLDALWDLLDAIEGPRYYLAGGTDLLVQAKEGLLAPATWIDIERLEALRGIREEAERVELGALLTFTDLEAHPVARRHAPALAEAAGAAAAVAIRNRATLGGNSGNASPAGDTLPPLYSLDAKAVLASRNAEREVPIADLFLGPKRNAVGREEIIRAFRIPRRTDLRGAFLRLGQRQAQAISKVSVAVSATLAGDTVSWLGIAFGAVAPTVIRAPEAEAIVTGKALDPATIAAAAEAAMGEVRPIDDIRSTATYRREQAGVLLRRALRRIASA